MRFKLPLLPKEIKQPWSEKSKVNVQYPQMGVSQLKVVRSCLVLYLLICHQGNIKRHATFLGIN